MSFLKFVGKTVAGATISALVFSVVLQKTLGSQAVDDIKNGTEKILNLSSSKSKEDKAKSDIISFQNDLSKIKDIVEKNISQENLTQLKNIVEKNISERNLAELKDEIEKNLSEDDISKIKEYIEDNFSKSDLSKLNKMIEYNLSKSGVDIKKINNNKEESTNDKEESTNNKKENIVSNIDVPENIKTNKNDNFIFIGDSRTVAYKNIVDISKYDFVTFISEVSEGYNWLKETAIEKLNTRFNTTDLSYNVVLNLGINDLHNVDKYIEYCNELAEKNTKHNFFVVSLNKVDTEKMKKKGYAGIENSSVEEFNTKMKNSLSNKIHFIDSYSYFKDKNLETNDGLHYSNNSSNEILNYITDYIKSI